MNPWTPLALDDIQPLLGDFDRWCLCGGLSIDLLLGRRTREHADTDIGVFRSDLDICLAAIDRGRRSQYHHRRSIDSHREVLAQRPPRRETGPDPRVPKPRDL